MGCWGITAFESDAGLDAMEIIRESLPKDGRLELGAVIEALKAVEWGVPDVSAGDSHTGPMILAEVVAKYLDHELEELDDDEAWAAADNKFRDLTSFTADRESMRWLRDYLTDSLKHVMENAEVRAQHPATEWDKQGGWRSRKNWLAWQEHMVRLAERLDGLLAKGDSAIELIRPQDQTAEPFMSLQM